MEQPTHTRSAGWMGGAVVGALLLVPPAVQLGILAARSVASHIAFLQFIAPEAAQPYVVLLAQLAAFAVTAALVLCLGGAAGMALQAALSPLGRFLPQRVRAWRPRWRALRVTILLAILGGALHYADRRVGLPWPEAAPPARSAWLEREKEIFG